MPETCNSLWNMKIPTSKAYLIGFGINIETNENKD